MKTDYSFYSHHLPFSLIAVIWVGTGVDRIRPCNKSEHGGDNEGRQVKD